MIQNDMCLQSNNNHDGSDSAVAAKSYRRFLLPWTTKQPAESRNIINNNGTERHFLCVREHNEHILDSEMSTTGEKQETLCAPPPQPLCVDSLKHILQKAQICF